MKRIPAVFWIFIASNALKLCLFTAIIVTTEQLPTFIYKFILSLFLLFPVVFFMVTRRTRFTLVLFYGLQAAYLFVNITYYMYFRRYPHFMMAQQLFGESMTLASTGGIPWYPQNLILFADLPVFLWLIKGYPRTREHLDEATPALRWGVGLCLAGALALEGMNLHAGKSIFQRNVHSGESSVVRRYGTLVNSAADLIKFRTEETLIARLDPGPLLTLASTHADRPNIICVQVEALDANVVRRRRNGEAIAPFLDSLAGSTLSFPYMLSYHLAGGTSDCEFTVLNSTEPLKNTPALKLRSYPFGNSIVIPLKKLGYVSYAFHGNWRSYYGRGDAYPLMGFNRFYDLEDMRLSQAGWGAPDGALLEYVLKTGKRQKTPFFFYVITMSTHHPFNHQASILGTKFGDVQPEITRNYLKTVHYTDSCLAVFVRAIRKELPNTAIFIYGDHSPGFDNATYVNGSIQDGQDRMEFVPLFIIPPGTAVPVEKKTMVSFLDLAPTVLSQTGGAVAIRSKGGIIGSGTLTDSPIHYQGKTFDRDELYQRVSTTFANPK